MSTHDERKQETRRLLLDAARSVYAREGILATPVSAVAREAGRSHGIVFVHFGSQDGLISAVVEDFGTTLASELHRLSEADAGPRTLLTAHLRGLTRHEGFYTRLVVEGPLLPPEARLSLVGIQSMVALHLLRAFDQATVRGTNPPGSFLFNTWIGLVHHHLAHRDLFAPSGSVLERCGPGLVDHFLTLIGVTDEDIEEEKR